MVTQDDLFEKLREHGGAIVSSNDCGVIEFNDAEITGRLWIDDDGFGFVWRTDIWLKLAEDSIHEKTKSKEQ